MNRYRTMPLREPSEDEPVYVVPVEPRPSPTVEMWILLIFIIAGIGGELGFY